MGFRRFLGRVEKGRLGPPSYEEAVGRVGRGGVNGERGRMVDDELEYLREFDLVFVVDDSGSMSMEGRWRQVGEVLAGIAPVCAKYDEDGIEICFINSSLTGRGCNSEDVLDVFEKVSPGGGTRMGRRLEMLLEPYMLDVERGCFERRRLLTGGVGMDEVQAVRIPKKKNVIVITDGQFADDVGSVVLDYARRLDECHAHPAQLGIQFFQVGTDLAAEQFLRRLDDQLVGGSRQGRCRDLVDHFASGGRQLEGVEQVMKVVLGAIHRMWDNQDTVVG